MRIRTQFITTMFLFGTLLVMIAASAIITTQQAAKVSEQEKIANSIAQGASELSYLSNDYLIYRETQQLNRWQSRFALLSRRVASLNAAKPEQQALVRNIQANQTRLKGVFDSVVLSLGTSSPNQKIVFDPAFFKVSWSRMAVQSQGLVSDASRLSQMLHAEADRLKRINLIVIFAMISIFVAYFLINSLIIQRRILKSIATLQAGTAMIGSGNLDFKLEEKKKDEIGDLSHAFNRMTTDLKAVTASKTDLEREVAERKRAESELRESEARIRSLGDNIPGGAIYQHVLNPDGRVNYAYMSAGIEKILGMPAEQVMADPDFFRDLILEEDRSRCAAAEDKSLRDVIPFDCEFRQRTITGGIRWVHCQSTPRRMEDGSVLWDGVVVDITKRKRAEETLRLSEEKFAQAFATNPAAIAITRLKDGLIIEANETWQAIFGYSREEIIGRSTLSLQIWPTPEDRARYAEAVREKGSFRGWEQPLLRKSGESIVLLGSAEKLTVAGEEMFLSTWLDITERKQAEEALQKAKDELEERVQERTEELAKSQERLQHLASQLLLAQEKERKRVAVELHDGLLSELAAMKFLLEGKMSLLEKGKPLDPSEFKRVSDILAMVMKEARRIMNNLHPSVLDELGLIAAMSWSCGEYQKSYPHIKIQREMAVSEEDIAEGVRVVIYRVLQEALNNFARHGKGDRVDLSLSKSDGTLEFMIRDNGQGFDVETAEKGLGLESMRERVELSGGKFHIQSIIGQGTTIRAIWSRS